MGAQEVYDAIWNMLSDYVLGLAFIIIGVMIARFASNRNSTIGGIFAFIIIAAGALSLPGEAGNSVQKIINVDDKWPIGG
jgi:hypothetical protein